MSMIRTIYAPSGAVAAIDIADTGSFLIGTADAADAPTRRLVPPPRRPDATGANPLYVPQTIGIVDAPLGDDQLPPAVQFALRPRSSWQRRMHSGTHRAHQPSLVERLTESLRRRLRGVQ
jgi:hypothetical protein